MVICIGENSNDSSLYSIIGLSSFKLHHIVSLIGLILVLIKDENIGKYGNIGTRIL